MNYTLQHSLVEHGLSSRSFVIHILYTLTKIWNETAFKLLLPLFKKVQTILLKCSGLIDSC